ncbi:sterile alpha motif domain-containing protein 1-like [Lagopus muta]|uniref:sterile alpha motif domain-containing protein 1-like n=1 Tax=Lagopus muta TaxID=64668 RepID=UPI0020A1D100|nr:sterile alpha motif domain-containing protein 1-like [Lagopus muta]XP_048803802.1 sterile alpha motif domain-containing protein 1-like [Lagopus muta]
MEEPAFGKSLLLFYFPKETHSTARLVRRAWAPGGPLRGGCSRTREKAGSDGKRAAPRRHLEGSEADPEDEAKAVLPRAQLPAGYCCETLPARRRRSPLGLPGLSFNQALSIRTTHAARRRQRAAGGGAAPQAGCESFSSRTEGRRCPGVRGSSTPRSPPRLGPPGAPMPPLPPGGAAVRPPACPAQLCSRRAGAGTDPAGPGLPPGGAERRRALRRAGGSGADGGVLSVWWMYVRSPSRAGRQRGRENVRPCPAGREPPECRHRGDTSGVKVPLVSSDAELLVAAEASRGVLARRCFPHPAAAGPAARGGGRSEAALPCGSRLGGAAGWDSAVPIRFCKLYKKLQLS